MPKAGTLRSGDGVVLIAVRSASILINIVFSTWFLVVMALLVKNTSLNGTMLWALLTIVLSCGFATAALAATYFPWEVELVNFYFDANAHHWVAQRKQEQSALNVPVEDVLARLATKKHDIFLVRVGRPNQKGSFSRWFSRGALFVAPK